jgi:uncharacterized protein YnzC (UPF0291/DUF896 family)
MPNYGKSLEDLSSIPREEKKEKGAFRGTYLKKFLEEGVTEEGPEKATQEFVNQ